MSIFDLFRTKKTEKVLDFDSEPFYSFTENIPVEIKYIPSPVGCEYCGNQSRVSDGRGGCVSCGAPLPRITKETELSYYYTT